MIIVSFEGIKQMKNILKKYKKKALKRLTFASFHGIIYIQ